MTLAWVLFLASSAVVFLASRGLVTAGDQIADRMGISRTFIGIFLLAAATSLPEVATSASAVAVVGAPDLAAGTIFGSNVFNLAVIALMDVTARHSPLLTLAPANLLLPSVLSGLAIGIAALFIVLHHWDLILPGWLYALFTPALLGFYTLALLWIYRAGAAEALEERPAGTARYQDGIARPILLYGVSTGAVLAGGLGLAYEGERIAALTGWGSSFLGSFFVAMATSLPEVATSFAALAVGARGMAVGNMVGSNLFNVGVIPLVSDLFYRQGLFLEAVSIVHLPTAIIGMAMTAVVATALLLRPRRKLLRFLSPEAVALVALFILAQYLVFSATPAG